MKIARETVQYVAQLANLQLTDEEVETYRRQLDDILGYVEMLDHVDTAAVEPMAQVGAGEAAAAWREDRVIPAGVADEALAAAPDAAPPFFRVPKVIEREP